MKTALISFLIINIAVFLVGYKVHQLPCYIPILNIVIGSILILYWVVESLNVRHLNIEQREMIVLSMEIFIVGFAIYSLLTKQEKMAINLVNYIGFGINFLAGFGMLIFLLTFKMNRLV
jgi:hypothetical protein